MYVYRSVRKPGYVYIVAIRISWWMTGVGWLSLIRRRWYDCRCTTINGDGGCRPWQPGYRRTHSLSRLAWVFGRRPLGTVLHSSNKPGELSQWLCHDDSTINICLRIIIIILNPRKTRVGKKLIKLKRMERLMFRAVVQLKTIVHYYYLLLLLQYDDMLDNDSFNMRWS